MNTQTPIHISDRFFAKAARYFGGFPTAIAEIIQNAYRASLPILESGQRPRLDVTTTTTMGKPSLRFRDYGMGIQDIGAALSIAVSGWDRSVEDEQDPAGMGLCAALAYSEAVRIRSDFGELIVDGPRFFGDEDYRNTLLDKILSIGGFEDGGTEIELIGPHFKPHYNTGNSLLDTVERQCFHHGAIDIWLHDDTNPEFESRLAKTFRNSWARVRDPATREDVTYAGYEVWRSSHSSSWLRTSEKFGVVWHGQFISVDLKAPELRRVVDLPGVGEVEVSPVVPDYLDHVIVIDHGHAPVTPKLPDRNALIYDEKTCDFIWGYLLDPMINQTQVAVDQINNTIDHYGTVEDCPHGVFEHTTHRAYNTKTIKVPYGLLVSYEIWARLYSRLIGAIVVTLPAWENNGDTQTFEEVYRRPEHMPAILEAAVVFHTTTDDRFVLVTPSEDLDADGTMLMFGHPPKKEGERVPGAVEVGDAWIPEGVGTAFSSRGMPYPDYDVALLVIDLPCSYDDVVSTIQYSWGSHTGLRNFVKTDAMLRTRTYTFARSPNSEEFEPLTALIENQDCTHSGTPDWRDGFKAVLKQAKTVRETALTAVAINTGAYTDPDDMVFFGVSNHLIELTHEVEDCMTYHDFDEEPDHCRDEIRSAFAALRQRVSGVAEINGQLDALFDRLGLNILSTQLIKLVVDATTGEAVVDYRDREGDHTFRSAYHA